MFRMGKNYIKVFHIPSDKSGEFSDAKKSSESSDKNAQEIAAKQFSETLIAELIKEPDTSKWKALYTKWYQEIKTSLGIRYQNSHFEVHMRTLNMQLFDGKWIIKNNPQEWIKRFIESMGLKKPETIKSEISPEKQKAVYEFKNKNPIAEYKNKLLDLCIKHPQQAYMWTKPKENPISLKEELWKINAIWWDKLPEYKALVETLLVIVDDLEYGRKTWAAGKISAFLWGRENVEEFKQNMRTFITIAVNEKKSLTMGDFRRQFDENRPLTEQESVYVTSYIANIEKKVKWLQETERLKLIDGVIVLKLSDTKVVDDKIHWLLVSMRSNTDRSSKEDIAGKSWDIWRTAIRDGRTKENETIALKKARELEKDNIPRFVDYDDTLRKYVILTPTDIAKWFLEKDLWGTDRAVFQSLLKIPNWTSFFTNNIGKDGIAAVWLYLKKKHDTELFKWAKQETKDFFLNAYANTVWEQSKILDEQKNKLSWKFEDLFPTLAKNPKITVEMQNKLKWQNVSEFYDLLVATWITNGEIKKVMESVTIDLKNLKEKSIVNAIKESEKWVWKTLNDVRTEFNLTNKTDIVFFDTISKKKLAIGAISPMERDKLLWLLPQTSQLYLFLQNLKTAESAGAMVAAAHQAKKTAEKKEQNAKASQLTTQEKQAIETAKKVGETKTNQESNEQLAKNNLKSGDIVWQEQRLKQATEDQKAVAISIASHVNTPGVSKEDARDLIRWITNTASSDKELDRWIDTQVFISKYVEEKNFVDIVERNASYMNLGQAKSVGELYGEWNKIDLSSMSSENGSMRLSETNILWNNSFQWMSELMNCKVEVWDSWLLTRTIRSPEWVIVAENVPLENIDSTIQQLGRFYALWLGSLAPYMQQVSVSIGKSRPDKITWLDGDFGISEDTKFLKILATMLYGQDSLPTDPNIPNLIAIFNRQWQENNPKYLLRKKWIVQDTWGMNTTRLDIELQLASKKVT